MSIPDIIERISRSTTEIISPESLEKKLAWSRKKKIPLRIKAGFDPTAPDIHLGHVVLLRKLRQFQDLGHVVYFVIGDFTAMVGDPTGQTQLRPVLSQKEIKANAQTYKQQVFKVLDNDPKKLRIVVNSVWLGKLSAREMLELAKHSTVAQMLARADFKKRYTEQKEISILEFMYPLLQGYDSVHLKADVELGGSDQKFNLLMGRQIQEVYGQDLQVVIMTPLLEGIDGIQKMSKSLGNYIGINEPPHEIFGKVMSINDDLMYRYYEILTDLDMGEIKSLHPKEAKLRLGEVIVEQFHGKAQASKARTDFEKTFSQRQNPQGIEEYRLGKDSMDLASILVERGLVSSKREYHRLIQQGAIHFEGEKLTDVEWTPKAGVLKVGKRRYLRLL
ncbi:MAG: tyrosine--tRNA ligase [Omnitrophica WOR_2 bacterium RIFCSPHIGHO2_02_FULL_52_10]|nr:MAG: tyrosine--tRNA ligase [Omnitrophica WOR_2 bacterium RIFCSPHIGHO2_02_FULL_52_10]